MTRKIQLVGGLAGLLLILLAAYANHFHNDFHFDDSHTIIDNAYIRSVRNIPRFFTDARTFSVLPTHASYRPLVSASLALDYWVGGALRPFFFHLSTFLWFLAQLALMYALFRRIMEASRPGPQNAYLALFAVAWYGLHPVNAETINYAIQRGDLYSTLGVVASLALYCYWPGGKKWGAYLLPVAAGALSKPSALMFAPILFVYILLFESEPKPENRPGEDVLSVNTRWPTARRALRSCLPALIVCAALGVFVVAMTPATYTNGNDSPVRYWLTQPIVLLHYFKSFFLPTGLSADTDRQAVSGLFSDESVIGLAFLCALIFVAMRTLRIREMRPVAFGLFWFLIASLPTSLVPLAEVENDHRMFFPFAGLVLAVCWSGAILLERRAVPRAYSPGLRAALVGVALCLLGAYAYGTHLRNSVWRSEESLWRDVVAKSPRNGRGLMNYGLTQLSKGNAPVAYDYFQRATAFTPNYSTLEVNLGVAAGMLHRDPEAEQHFQRAIALAPQDSQPYFFYGRWLQGQGRISEAVVILNKSAATNPTDLASRYALMPIYEKQADWVGLKRAANEVLRVTPADAEGLRFLALAQNGSARVTAPEPVAGAQPTPENYLNLSLFYYRSGRYEDCIRAAREALRLRPDYAEAYNNIAATYQSMGRWDDAIPAATEAIRLRPDFQLARNNLAYATSQKALFTTKNPNDKRLPR